MLDDYEISVKTIAIGAVSSNFYLNTYVDPEHTKNPWSEVIFIAVTVLKTGHTYKISIKTPTIWESWYKLDSVRAVLLIETIIEALPQYQAEITTFELQNGIGLYDL